jgi:hypothetical protein
MLFLRGSLKEDRKEGGFSHLERLAESHFADFSRVAERIEPSERAPGKPTFGDNREFVRLASFGGLYHGPAIRFTQRAKPSPA